MRVLDFRLAVSMDSCKRHEISDTIRWIPIESNGPDPLFRLVVYIRRTAL